MGRHLGMAGLVTTTTSPFLVSPQVPVPMTVIDEKVKIIIPRQSARDDYLYFFAEALDYETARLYLFLEHLTDAVQIVCWHDAEGELEGFVESCCILEATHDNYVFH